MNIDRAQLIGAAKAVCGHFELRDEFSAGSVGAALITDKGNIYTGICIDLACGLGFCAEVAAIAEMLKNRETHIVSIVAVTDNMILPPCGRCRETMAQIDPRNLNCNVIMEENHDVMLRTLLPQYWMDKFEDTVQ
jgi:cytidine deaminase